MKLHVSFEQECLLADARDNWERLKAEGIVEGNKDAFPKSANAGKLDTGYVVIADADLYDGPGAKAPPGNILACIGPMSEKFWEENVAMMKGFLEKLGHEVSVP